MIYNKIWNFEYDNHKPHVLETHDRNLYKHYEHHLDGTIMNQETSKNAETKITLDFVNEDV